MPYYVNIKSSVTPLTHLWSRCMTHRCGRGPSHTRCRHTLSPSSCRAPCQQQRATSGSADWTCHSAWCWGRESKTRDFHIHFNLQCDRKLTSASSTSGVSRWRCPSRSGRTIRWRCLCSAAPCSSRVSESCSGPGGQSVPYLKPESTGTGL